MAEKLRPLHDHLLAKQLEEEEKTAGGIIIPDTAKEKPYQAEVVAVGAGRRMDDGSIRPLSVKVGDKVLYERFAGTAVKLDGDDYMIMREDDVLAIIEK